MKLVFVNRFFFPDSSATSQMLSDLAFHLAARGREVHVVTSRVPGATAAADKVRDVTVHRIATAPSGPHGLVHRAFAYGAFLAGARQRANALVNAGDVVVLKTDPPMLAATVGPVVLRRGAKLVNWLQDVFPEVAERYGVPGTGGVTGKTLRRWRDRSIARAAKTIVIGDLMAEHVRRLDGVRGEDVAVIHNWSDGELIKPIDTASNELRKAWFGDAPFVVGYSGNLGRVHEFDTMMKAIGKLRDDVGIHFLIVGHGPRLAEFKSRIWTEGLANVRFEPRQDSRLLSQSLCAADVHLSTLRPDFEGLVHPSKLYGVMASGRPTLFIGDPRGETARILERTGAGIAVKTGDSDGLAAAILRLRDEPALRHEMGGLARRAFEANYEMRVAFAKWEALLDSLTT